MTVWVGVCNGGCLYGWATVNCMDGSLYGWVTVWVGVCMGGWLYGWESVWVRVCMSGCLYGWVSVWVGVCMVWIEAQAPILFSEKLILNIQSMIYLSLWRGQVQKRKLGVGGAQQNNGITCHYCQYSWCDWTHDLLYLHIPSLQLLQQSSHLGEPTYFPPLSPASNNTKITRLALPVYSSPSMMIDTKKYFQQVVCFCLEWSFWPGGFFHLLSEQVTVLAWRL